MLKRNRRIGWLALVLATALISSSQPALAACSWCTTLTKHGDEMRATGSGILGAVGALEGGIELIGQGVDWLWDKLTSSVNEPDPNHSALPTLASPVSFAAIQCDSCPAKVVISMNRTLLAAGSVLDQARLLRMALRRYYGALADNNSADAAMQQFAASRFLYALEGKIGVYHDELVTLGHVFEAEGYTNIPLTIQDVLDYRDAVAVSGFPPFEAGLIAQMNTTSEELAGMVANTALTTGDALVGSQLVAPVMILAYADQLANTNVRSYLPPSFTPVNAVPSTSRLGVILAGMMLALLGSRAVVRRRLA